MESRKIRVVLISSIVPGNSGGGGLVMKRHLEGAENVELLVVSDGRVSGFEHFVLPHKFLSRLLKRFMNGPFTKWACDLNEFIVPCDRSKLARVCREFRPDVVLTVAHGGLARMALAEAISTNLPLVTVFHDWWPDLSRTHRFVKPFFDNRFRKLSRKSSFCLCVSDGMWAALGKESKGEVLLPIPSSLEKHNIGNKEESPVGYPIKIAYMGNLGDYGGMMKEAIEESLNHPGVRIEVCGRQTTWGSEFEDRIGQLGVWHGFLSDEQLRAWLASVDVFLVAMRFEKRLRRFMETSFPSKILEYAQFHKPIVVWGPEYCSAVRWARASGGALCVTDPAASALVSALDNLSIQERNHLGNKARESATGEFNPTKIQEQFLAVLKSAARIPESVG